MDVSQLAKEAIKPRVMDVKITWVSNYRYPITKSSNRTSVIGHPRDRTPITWQIGARRTNHDREFCYRYDYDYKCEQSKENFVFGPRTCVLFSVDSGKCFSDGGSCCHWRVRKLYRSFFFFCAISPGVLFCVLSLKMWNLRKQIITEHINWW